MDFDPGARKDSQKNGKKIHVLNTCVFLLSRMLLEIGSPLWTPEKNIYF
jgi:hypothetical protein